MSSKEKEHTENVETKKKPQHIANLRETPKNFPGDKRKRKPLGKIGYLLLYFGLIALVSSIIYNSSILAFIGLGLTLWGGLFLYAKPVRYVKEVIFNSTTISSLVTIDKILTELNQKGRGVHLPPKHLEQLKESIVFIPTREDVIIPPVKDVTKERVFLNPDGVRLTAPGQGLLTLYEEKLGTNLSKIDFDYLKNSLPKLLIEDLELLEDLEIEKQHDVIHVKMKLSAYKDLCRQVRKHTSICSHFGCPLCSSIACALAKSMGKAVILEKNEVTTDGKTIRMWYRLIKYG